MRRRSTLLAIVLFSLALLTIISSAILIPSSQDITIPIDRSALDNVPVLKPAQSDPAMSETQKIRSLALSPVPDPRLIEQSSTTRLPRIADNGDRPADIYARPVATSPDQTGLPQLAIVVLRAGLSEVITAEAYLAFPPEVSFAISPYARDGERQVRDIRNRGHEVFLEVLSVAGDPAREDRGPLSIDPAVSEQINRNRLYKTMSQLSGYAGLIGDLNSEFQREKSTLLLNEAKARGLHYLAFFRPDSRSTEISYGSDDDAARGISRRLVIGTDPATLQTTLSSLIPILQSEGKLVLLIEPGPFTIDMIKDWIDGSQSRTFRLVPLSAMLRSESAI